MSSQSKQGMETPKSSYPQAHIQDVYIELKDYQFLHTPFDQNAENNYRFIGRKKFKDRIKMLLGNSANASGTYLVTGFRGMGKTSMLRSAVHEFNVSSSKTWNLVWVATLPSLLAVFNQMKKYIVLCLVVLIVDIALHEKSWPDVLNEVIDLFGNTKNPGLLHYHIKSYYLAFLYLAVLWPLLIVQVASPLRSIGNFVRRLAEGRSIFQATSSALINDIRRNVTSPSAVAGFLALLCSLFLIICWVLYLAILFSVEAVTGVEGFRLFNIIYLLIGWGCMLLFNTIFTERSSIGERVGYYSWSLFQFIAWMVPLIGFLGFVMFPVEFCDCVLWIECIPTCLAYIFIDLNEFSLIGSIILGVLLVYALSVLFYLAFDSIRGTFSMLVNRLLHRTQYQYHTFEINLSQESVEVKDVLKRICDRVLDYWISNEYFLNDDIYTRRIYKPIKFLRSLILPSSYNGNGRYGKIRKRAETLKNRFVASMSQSDGYSGEGQEGSVNFSFSSTGMMLPLSRGQRRRTVSYPIVSAKEAEDELIDLLREIDDFRKVRQSVLPKFLFIVDELDKIEPQSSQVMEDKELAVSASTASMNLPGSREFQKRQELVSGLLADLKGFFNVAKAKFFFIGGRELFDADLADIADRDSFYSSIFSDVIYVDTFYKDKVDGQNKSGITAMVEAFLVNTMIGDHKGMKQPLSLERFSGAIQHSDGFMYVSESRLEEPHRGDSMEAGLDFQRHLKVITVLQNLITYLTYRSTGSPKKLTGIVERSLIRKRFDSKMDLLEFNADNTVLWRGYPTDNHWKRERMFIRVGYTDQYLINLTCDIFRPYLVMHTRYLKSLGDKLLFSTPFIFDHIVKFYPFGFSWRNLELIPEVILVNKEPHLREHIQSIMRFLSNHHIKDTVSGIFDYKFHSVIRKELSIMSKLDDMSSAAFNFTLDESLLVKRHYKLKLLEIRSKYKDYTPIPGDNHFIHSLSFVQTILGNLHFYDKEYDQAIIYYTESIQALRLPNAIGENLITRHQFLLWILNKLKIALALEKMRAYESAISYYRTIVMDSGRFLTHIADKNSDIIDCVDTIKSKQKTTKRYYKEHKEDRESVSSEVHRNLHSLVFPFVGILHAIEKSRVDGITEVDLKTSKKEFEVFLWNINTNQSEVVESMECLSSRMNEEQRAENEGLGIDYYRKGWLVADYLDNVGSILFYKNCFFPYMFKQDSPQETIESKTKTEEILEIRNAVWLDWNIKQEDAAGRSNGYEDISPSYSALIYYWDAAKALICHLDTRLIEIADKRSMYQISNFNSLQRLSLCALGDFQELINGRRQEYMANILSKTGDALLSCLSAKNIVFNHENVNIYDTRTNKKNKRDKLFYNLIESLGCENLFDVNSVVSIYQIASLMYKKAGKSYYQALMLKKVLYLIKDALGIKNDKVCAEERAAIQLLCQGIVKEIIKITSWHNEVADRWQVRRYRSVVGTEDIQPETNSLLYASVSNRDDVYEVVYLAEMINQRLSGRPSELVVRNTDQVRSKYLRMMELKFIMEQSYEKVCIHKAKVKSIFKTSDKIVEISERITIGDYKFLLEELLNAVFALRESIVIIQLYDPGYLIGYSYLAKAHERAAQWSIAFENIRQISLLRSDFKKEFELFEKRLVQTIGRNSLLFMDANYQREVALQNYHKMIQMHREGNAYRTKIKHIYYLEDDLNDQMTHFTIALERLQINSGFVRKYVDKIRRVLDKKSKFYKYENYVPPRP